MLTGTEGCQCITIDGVTLTSPDNSIDDVIEGVTIDLKEVTTDPDDGGPITINIEPDTAKMEESINAIIDAFNGVVSTIDDLNETTFDNEEGRSGKTAFGR